MYVYIFVERERHVFICFICMSVNECVFVCWEVYVCDMCDRMNKMYVNGVPLTILY